MQRKPKVGGGSRSYDVWLRRGLITWMILFTLATGFAIRKARETSDENRDLIIKVSEQTASVKQLQKTNCGLEKFLLTARRARYDSAQEKTGAEKDSDMAAVAGYKNLALQFATADDACEIPKHLKLPGDKPNEFN